MYSRSLSCIIQKEFEKNVKILYFYYGTFASKSAYLYPESLPYTSIAPNRNEYR